jgi:PAS domain-containing protein
MGVAAAARVITERRQAHLYVNRKFVEMFGYDGPDDIIGEATNKIAHPDDEEMVTHYDRVRQEGGPAPSRYEFKGMRRTVRPSSSRPPWHPPSSRTTTGPPRRFPLSLSVGYSLYDPERPGPSKLLSRKRIRRCTVKRRRKGERKRPEALKTPPRR